MLYASLIGTRFFARVCVLSVPCVLVVSLALQAATPREELLRLVPDSVGFCLVVQDLRGHAAAWRNSPFLEQLRRSSFADKIRNSDKLKTLDRIDAELKEKLGFDGKRLCNDILGDALVLAYRPGSPGHPQQEQGAMLLRARDEKALADLIERINKVQKEEGELKDLSERRHKDIVYYRRLEYDKSGQCDKPPTFYYVHGPVLALSEQESTLQQIIERDHARPSEEIGEAARRLRELDAERALLAVWINPRAFDAEVQAKAASTSAERSTAAKHFALYWKALESVVLSLSPQDRDINLSLGVRARIAELPPAARRLFNQAATASDLWRRFPQSALLAVGGRLDGAALLDAVGGFLTPQGRHALHAALNRPFATLLAEDDFSGGLLPALGPDCGLCLSAPSAGARGSQPARSNAGLPHLLFALRLDGKRTKKPPERTLLTALDFAARFVVFAHNNQHPDSPLSLKTGAVDGQEVHYLAGERGLPVGVQPAYGLLNGYLVLASSLESMNRFAQTPPNPAPAADAPVPLLRISFADWRSYLTEHRDSIVQLLMDGDKLSHDAAALKMDGLLAVLHFVERAELSQRTAPGQVIFALNVRTAEALKK